MGHLALSRFQLDLTCVWHDQDYSNLKSAKLFARHHTSKQRPEPFPSKNLITLSLVYSELTAPVGRGELFHYPFDFARGCMMTSDSLFRQFPIVAFSRRQ